ncbi:MAG TPA: tetratricopeptide repeat protein [Rhodanobacteraceae bacterium]|nr:tetratricopeptide repeat protein [Rhodanobacteraceae bacterium]
MKRSLFAELKRRNVIRAAILYVGAVWALAQGIAQLTPVVDAPEWAARWFLVSAVVGFPFWIAFAWFFEFTPEGLKRESDIAPGQSITRHTGRKLDVAIITVLAVAVVLLLTDRFVLRHGVNAGAQAASIPEIDKDPSIAVLPLTNMSEDKGNEYFSDGISEELLNLLAKVPRLRVIARTSSFSFKGKDTSIQDIARVLQVAAILEGSVRKSGDTVRITVQLIRAKDGSHLWSESYDRRLDDIFKVQDEIAANVVGNLRITLLGSLPTARRVDPRVYPLILQADALVDQSTAASNKQALALYQEVLATAPDEARAWSGVGRVYLNQNNIQLAKEAQQKAITLDPDNAVAYSRLGFMTLRSDGDLAAAASDFQRAFALDPADVRVIGNAATFLQGLGRLNEAIPLSEYGAVHDPANPISYFNVCALHFYARHWDQAIASCRAALRLSAGFTTAHFFIGVVLLLGKDDAAAALQEFEAEPVEEFKLAGVANAQRALEHAAESDAALMALTAGHAQDAAYYIATVYAYRGEHDRAFEWLDKAVVNQHQNLFTVASEPQFDRLHDDPRWLALLRRLGKAPEQLAKIKFEVALPQADGNPASGPAHP